MSEKLKRGAALIELCTAAAKETRGRHAKIAFVALGRAVAAQGAHVASGWVHDFDLLMKHSADVLPRRKGRKVH